MMLPLNLNKTELKNYFSWVLHHSNFLAHTAAASASHKAQLFTLKENILYFQFYYCSTSFCRQVSVLRANYG